MFNGKITTISMAIFNSYVKLPEGNREKLGVWSEVENMWVKSGLSDQIILDFREMLP